MSRFLVPLLLAAGACDTLTGALLLANPAGTLALMRIPGPPADPALVQFIGAFVLAVGSSYFLPFLCFRGPARTDAIRHILAFTAWIRVCIALATGGLVATGRLPAAWLSVTATDTALALAQLALLFRGGKDHAR